MSTFQVSTVICCRYATTEIVNRKVNSSENIQETDFDVHLPFSAYVTQFTIEKNGAKIVGKIQDKEARKYAHLVNKVDDVSIIPTKLNYSSKNMQAFSVRVKLDPGKAITFRLTYQEFLERRQDFFRYLVHLPAGRVTVSVRILDTVPFKEVKHPFLAEKLDAKSNLELAEMENEPSVAVTYSETNGFFVANVSGSVDEKMKTESQLAILYDLQEQDGGQLYTSDGFFAAFVHCFDRNLRRKETVFALDVSSSMSGLKMESVKQATWKQIEAFSETDTFNLITFGDEAKKWRIVSPAASEKNKQEAKNFLDSLKPRGGTNLEEGLRLGAEVLRKKVKAQPRLGAAAPPGVSLQLILVTDGEPTVGLMNPDDVLRCLLEHEILTVHCVALGKRADYRLLRRIATKTGGETLRVTEDQDYVSELTKFFAEVQSSTLADLKFELTAGSVKNGAKIPVTEVSQNQKKDLYVGQDRVIVGKLPPLQELPTNAGYVSFFGTMTGEDSSGGTAARVLRGKKRSEWKFSNGEMQTSPKTMDEVIEGIWAFTTVKDLLSRARYGEPDVHRQKDLREKARSLSIKYQFMTELTEMAIPCSSAIGRIVPKEEKLFHACAPSKENVSLPVAWTLPADRSSVDTSSFEEEGLEEAKNGTGNVDESGSCSTLSQDLPSSEYISAVSYKFSTAKNMPSGDGNRISGLDAVMMVILAAVAGIIGFLLGYSL